MSFHTCASDGLWGAASCSLAGATFKAPPRQLYAWCGVWGFSIASVSAPRTRNRDNFHTAVRRGSVGYFFLSLTGDKEERLASGGFRERRRTDRAHVWSTSRILEQARSPEWMVTIRPLFTSPRKVFESHWKEEWMRKASGIVVWHAALLFPRSSWKHLKLWRSRCWTDPPWEVHSLSFDFTFIPSQKNVMHVNETHPHMIVLLKRISY